MGFLDTLFGPPDKDAFAKLAVEHLRRQGETRPIDYDPRRFQLVIGQHSEKVHFLWLENAYQEYCGVPRSARAAVLQRYLDIARDRELPEKDVALRNVLPRVRDRSYYSLISMRIAEQFADQAQTKPFSLPHRPVGEHFAAGLVFDLPASVMDLSADRFEEWKVGFDEAFLVALKNLKEISVAPFETTRPGVFVSPFRDNHDPARLLLESTIRSLSVRGDPVAMVPNRDTLIITGSEDEAGLSEMAALAKVALLDPRPMAAIAMRLTERGWVPFHPPRGEAGDALRLLSIQAAMQRYADQKELLDQHFARTGRDVFVATYTAVQNKETGRVSAYATWSRDVDTLLPRTDDIFFVDFGEGPEPEVTPVPWDAAAAVVGGRMRREVEYPERWRVDTFPTTAELELMRARRALA